MISTLRFSFLYFYIWCSILQIFTVLIRKIFFYTVQDNQKQISGLSLYVVENNLLIAVLHLFCLMVHCIFLQNSIFFYISIFMQVYQISAKFYRNCIFINAYKIFVCFFHTNQVIIAYLLPLNYRHNFMREHKTRGKHDGATFLWFDYCISIKESKFTTLVVIIQTNAT